LKVKSICILFKYFYQVYVTALHFAYMNINFIQLFIRSYCSENHRENSKSNKGPSSDTAVDYEMPLDLRAAGLTGVLKTAKSLFTNGPYVFSVLHGTFDAIIINGFVSFGAKYLQQQFGLTATMAGIAFGWFFYIHS